MTMKRLVTGLLKTRGQAEAAVQRILDDGHVLGDISLMMSDKAIVPPQRAELYEKGLQNGGILLGVHVRSKAEVDRIEWIFDEFGADHSRVGNTGEDPSDSCDWRPISL